MTDQMVVKLVSDAFYTVLLVVVAFTSGFAGCWFNNFNISGSNINFRTNIDFCAKTTDRFPGYSITSAVYA